MKLGKVEVGSNIAQNQYLESRKSYLVIIAQIHKFAKNESRQVQ